MHGEFNQKIRDVKMWFKWQNNLKNAKRDVICDYLEETQNNKRALCVCLTGDWGSGKTYRWEKSISPFLNRRASVYISCFGKTELSEFKLELLDGLLKKKNLIVKLGTWLMCTMISTIIVSGIVFSALGFINKTPYWITLISINGISAILSGWYYTSLVKYFSNKIIGVDHNNIDFKQVWKFGKKPVLCFDDLERITTSCDCCKVLGFVEKLKNLGYPILLIVNSRAMKSESWERFKEKVVNKTIIVEPSKENLDSVISKYHFLDKTEKTYLKDIFNIWSITTEKEIEEYDRDVFYRIHNNFRLLEAIIVNIGLVRKYVKNYRNLDKYIKTSLLSYIGLYTLVVNLEIDSALIYKNNSITFDFTHEDKNTLTTESKKIMELYRNVIKGETKKIKRFGDLVVIQWPFDFKQMGQVQQLLDIGTASKSIDFNNKISKTEILASGFKVLFSRTPEIEKFVIKLKKEISKEKEPFSTIDSMGQILTILNMCYEFLQKKFNKKDFAWLLPIIKKTIQTKQKEFSLDYQLIGLSSQRDNTYHYVAGEYLNMVFVEYSIENAIHEKIQTKTFWDEFIDFYRKGLTVEILLCLYVLFKDKQKQRELFKMKEKNYKKYIKLMQYIISSINLQYPQKSLNQISGDDKNFIISLKTILKKDIQSLKKLPRAKIAEENIMQELLQQFGTVNV